MRGTEFLDKMELIDFSYVEEADRMPVRNRYMWLRWGSMAACAVLVTAFCLLYVPYGDTETSTETTASPTTELTGDTAVDDTETRAETESTPPVYGNTLPLLTITEDMGGMGYEGYMAYDISDLVSGNPWYDGCGLTVMPVYENAIGNTDYETMYALLWEVAGRFGVTPGDVTYTDNTPDAETRQKYVEKMKEQFGLYVTDASMISSQMECSIDGHQVIITPWMRAKIFLKEEIVLPEGYNAKSDKYEDHVALAEYYLETYSSWIGLENPQIAISRGDYNIYNDRYFTIGFYEKGENLTEDIINERFYQVQFICNDDGNLYMIQIDTPDLSCKVDDYPIISVEEATNLLRDGRYITTVPYPWENNGTLAEHVVKVELMYRNASFEEYFMPYYRFYVELPGWGHNDNPDMKDYGAYYVPAVEGQYIENMPLWDGRFN